MKKLKYCDVKKYIENFGYKLVSENYENSHSKLNLICNIGHDVKMNFNNFQQGQRCSMCVGVKKHTYKNIKEYIESFGYRLISKKYHYNKTKLKIICSDGHGFYMTYNNFQRGHRCPVCAGNKKCSYSQVKQYIEEFGYQLVSNEYRNNKTKLDLVCPKGHFFETKYGSFRNGRRCPECAKSMVTSKGEKEVLNFVQSVYNGRIIENDRAQIINPLTGRFLELDIFLPELNKAIEYNGEWWHSKKNAKYRDNQKQDQCKNKGIDLLVIEEKSWMEYKNYNMINSFICEES